MKPMLADVINEGGSVVTVILVIVGVLAIIALLLFILGRR